MISERKKKLVRDCAAEAVVRARLEIAKNLEAHDLGNHPVAREIKCVLAEAERRAGYWAILATEADMRLVPGVRDITGAAN